MDKVQHTKNYDQFDLMSANRGLYEGHLQRLDKAFEENGNITKIQPITVNERMQVIDGQHRLEICRRRGLNVYYIVVPGLTVRDARQMNILHRGWGPEDYAKSYAASGNKNYQTYLTLKEEFGAPHRLIIKAIYGGTQRLRVDADFRNGDMVVQDVEKARELLNLYITVRELTGIRERAFYEALWNVGRVDGYSHKRMLAKLAAYAPQLYQPLVRVEDNMRQLEDIYNYNQAGDTRLRLY